MRDNDHRNAAVVFQIEHGWLSDSASAHQVFPRVRNTTNTAPRIDGASARRHR
jgi:hypothetical protein